MKAIYRKHKRLTLLGFLGTLGIIVLHYVAILTYIAIFQITDYFAFHRYFFFENINSYNWIIFYFVFFSPALNALFHIIYRDSGLVIWRMMLWLSSTIIIFSLPIFIFVA